MSETMSVMNGDVSPKPDAPTAGQVRTDEATHVDEETPAVKGPAAPEAISEEAVAMDQTSADGSEGSASAADAELPTDKCERNGDAQEDCKDADEDQDPVGGEDPVMVDGDDQVMVDGDDQVMADGEGQDLVDGDDTTRSSVAAGDDEDLEPEAEPDKSEEDGEGSEPVSVEDKEDAVKEAGSPKVSPKTAVLVDGKSSAEVASVSSENKTFKLSSSVEITKVRQSVKMAGVVREVVTLDGQPRASSTNPRQWQQQQPPPPHMSRSAGPLTISSSVLTALAQYGISTSGMSAEQLHQLQEYYRRSQNDTEFILEAPSFIVPYVRESPPQSTVKQLLDAADGADSRRTNGESTASDGQQKKDGVEESNKENKPDEKAAKDKSTKREEDFTHLGKWAYYYQGPVGQFVLEQGRNIVEEFIKEDLLKQQKRKAGREKAGGSEATRFAIKSLSANLAASREKNAPFRLKKTQCRYCAFESESILAMERHLEIPHMVGSIFQCNFCDFETRSHQVVLVHMSSDHSVQGRLERTAAAFQCPLCPYEDSGKARMARHVNACQKKFRPERNQSLDEWTPPAKVPRVHRGRPSILGKQFEPVRAAGPPGLQPMSQQPGGVRARGRPVGSYKDGPGQTSPAGGRGSPQFYNSRQARPGAFMAGSGGMQAQMMRTAQTNPSTHYQIGSQVYQLVNNQLVPLGAGAARSGVQITAANHTSLPSGITIQPSSNKSGVSGGAAAALKLSSSPSISITPVPRPSLPPSVPSILRTGAGGQVSISKVQQPVSGQGKAGAAAAVHNKGAFVICEICDGYIKDLEQLRNHMQWIHKVKIHPKMIYNRPPLNCQKCQLRFFTDQGLERHLLGSHGLVTSSMQEAANKGHDSGRCPVCGKVFQWKLLHHVAKDHRVTLKPAHLSYKCTVCSATFSMYKQFENHVYSTHSIVAKKIMESSDRRKAAASSGGANSAAASPMRINDEITIIPHPTASRPTTAKPGPRRLRECELCEFTAGTAAALVQHYRTEHLGRVQVEFTPLQLDPQLADQVTDDVREQLRAARDRADTVEVEVDEVDSPMEDGAAGKSSMTGVNKDLVITAVPADGAERRTRLVTVPRPRHRVGPRSAHRRWRAQLAPKSVLLARRNRSKL